MLRTFTRKVVGKGFDNYSIFKLARFVTIKYNNNEEKGCKNDAHISNLGSWEESRNTKQIRNTNKENLK